MERDIRRMQCGQWTVHSPPVCQTDISISVIQSEQDFGSQTGRPIGMYCMSGQGLFTRNFSGVGLTRVYNLSSLIERLGWLDQCRGQSCMFLARHYLMFESEDFCLGHYLTILKAPTGLDHFVVEIFFYIASEQTSRPKIRQADISYLFF